jgi:hypothetical protein
MARISFGRPVLLLLALAVLSACDGQASTSNPPAGGPGPADPGPVVPGPAAAPRECSGQPCCGDPPRPCGEVIEQAIGRRCKTACDCGTQGLACNQGACASGTVAVFCCDTCPQTAPPAQVCQRRDGSTATCGPR